MKIGIDVRMWAESGIGRYVRNLVWELRNIESDDEYVLFCLEKDKAEIELVLVGQSRWRVVIANYSWYSFSEQLFFPWLLYTENFAVMHFPHFNVPILYLKKFVVTIHDLTHFTFAMKRASTRSGFLYDIKHAAYALAFNVAVRRGKKLITVSKYVQQQLRQKFAVPESKIKVTYEAAEKPIPVSENEVRGVLQKYGIKEPYFLYVGNAHPHKNIEFLLQGFGEYLKQSPGSFLVLAGKKNYFWERVITENKMQNVIYTGYVEEKVLAALYSRALAYVFPSLSEGFGLPVLEAMAYGCPVLSSDATCLPEIGGSAVIYFNPRSMDSLLEAMNLMGRSEEVREKYIKLGFAQMEKFSWKKMAEDTRQVYLDC
jgi:glycosyltransferase involved in cell wall biosynthesis